jgi:hypothetical protein
MWKPTSSRFRPVPTDLEAFGRYKRNQFVAVMVGGAAIGITMAAASLRTVCNADVAASAVMQMVTYNAAFMVFVTVALLLKH